MKQSKEEKNSRSGAPPAQRPDVMRSLWEITARGNPAEVRQRDGRLIVYEVKKHIAVG